MAGSHLDAHSWLVSPPIWTKVRSKWTRSRRLAFQTRAPGFLGLIDLPKVAKHGKGENIYLIRFHYVSPRSKRTGQPKSV